VLASKLAVLPSLSVTPADDLEKRLVAAYGFYVGATDLGSVSSMSNVLQMLHGGQAAGPLGREGGPWRCAQQVKDPPPVVLAAAQARVYIKGCARYICCESSRKKL